MALISCGECAGKVSDSAAACPHCGAPVAKPAVYSSAPPPAQVKKSGGTWKWVLGVPVGFFVLMMVIGGLNSDPEKTQAREAYNLCMDNLKADDRARAGNGRLIAGACERLRDEFKQKYGTTP